MHYGQIVIGPPGSGKTTYCNGMQQFLTSMGRKVAIINLDPANDQIPYEVDVDISELVCLEEVMKHLNLGPNGGLLYCMKYLEENISWLIEKVKILKDSYILFDLPGQVELYTHEDCLHNAFKALSEIDMRMTVVHLVDAHHCTDSSKFISVVLLSLSSMVRLELPHINVLSKIDLVEQYGELAFNLDFYTEVLDLRYLLNAMDQSETESLTEDSCNRRRNSKKFLRLNEVLIDVIEDYSLVTFYPLNISDGATVRKVVEAVDKCNGYVYGTLNCLPEYTKDPSIWNSAACVDPLHSDFQGTIQERYVTSRPIEEDLDKIDNSS